MTNKLGEILIRPILTEKASGELLAFKVNSCSSKTDIKNAVEQAFSVKVDSVRTANIFKKIKGQRTRRTQASTWKKAYISLKPGHKIDLIEGV